MMKILKQHIRDQLLILKKRQHIYKVSNLPYNKSRLRNKSMHNRKPLQLSLLYNQQSNKHLVNHPQTVQIQSLFTLIKPLNIAANPRLMINQPQHSKTKYLTFFSTTTKVFHSVLYIMDSTMRHQNFFTNLIRRTTSFFRINLQKS